MLGRAAGSAQSETPGALRILRLLRPFDEFPLSVGILRARPTDLAEVAQPEKPRQHPALARLSATSSESHNETLPPRLVPSNPLNKPGWVGSFPTNFCAGDVGSQNWSPSSEAESVGGSGELDAIISGMAFLCRPSRNRVGITLSSTNIGFDEDCEIPGSLKVFQNSAHFIVR